MAERSLIQYQPITGPVWTGPVAATLAWLPQGQHQPARSLEYRRIGDFKQPPFVALYRPDGLQWLPRGTAPRVPLERRILGDFQQPPFQALYNPARGEWAPEDSYRGRPLSRTLREWTVFQPVIAAPAYDPRTLEWMPQGRAPQVPVERRICGDFQQPPFSALYNPRTLEWIPQGRAPQIPVERRILGDFEQPPFSALYRPEGLQWQSIDEYRGRELPRARLDWTVELQLVSAPAYDPQTLEWQARDRYVPRGLPRVALDLTVEPISFSVGPYDPRTLEWIPSARSQLPIELRRVGWFAQPPFQSLYKPEGLQWQASDRYYGRPLPRGRADFAIPSSATLYRPERLEWRSIDSYSGRPIPFSRQGWAWAFSIPIGDIPPTFVFAQRFTAFREQHVFVAEVELQRYIAPTEQTRFTVMDEIENEYTFRPIIKDAGETRKVELDLFGKCANFWRANEQFGLNEFIRAEQSPGFSYEATIAGTSGSRPPTFPRAIGQTVTDGSITWTCRAAATNGLNAVSSPSGTSDPTGLTIANIAVIESTKIYAEYSGGTVGQQYDAVFTFTLNGVTRVARQTVLIRKR